ncbi:6-pyruvoyl trahydropterin synthase family protein [Paraburkholderia adhaesiva]|uniref:6-pyruvoyl trahydropterin synthase family protein n=1 Tax=Paraburkholderia adhaesiva TaxID=2883244 RepID=UPI001F44FF32|nr:6-carboxytetrahydropterin synthase [Paraburkholderia adhaesiva]
MIRATRYHDISCGHRVVGHEGKCVHLHGHNYRVHFSCEAAALDAIGRVIDFGVIKERLCGWLEDQWDHRMLLWCDDPWLPFVREIDATVVSVPFNPTAENMAQHLVMLVGPVVLDGTGVRLVEVTVEETRKCSATYSR